VGDPEPEIAPVMLIGALMILTAYVAWRLAGAP
jgi:hypothetical protein